MTLLGVMVASTLVIVAYLFRLILFSRTWWDTVPRMAILAGMIALIPIRSFHGPVDIVQPILATALLADCVIVLLQYQRRKIPPVDHNDYLLDVLHRLVLSGKIVIGTLLFITGWISP